jgi:hypothetical protein
MQSAPQLTYHAAASDGWCEMRVLLPDGRTGSRTMMCGKIGDCSGRLTGAG